MGHSYHTIVIPSYRIQGLSPLEVLWREFHCTEVTCLIHRVCHDLGLDFGAKIKPTHLSEDPNFLNTLRESRDPKFICHRISLKIHNFQKISFWKTKILATLRRTPAAKSGGAKKQKKDTVEVRPILSTWTSISNNILSSGGT